MAGREEFTRPLPGESHRVLGHFEKYKLCGPAGGESGILDASSGGGSTTYNDDAIRCEQDGTNGAWSSVSLPSVPSNHYKGGRVIGYIGFKTSDEPDGFADCTVHLGFIDKDQSTDAVAACRISPTDDMTLHLNHTNGTETTDPMYGRGIEQDFPETTRMQHLAIVVNNERDRMEAYPNANPFFDEPAQTTSSAFDNATLPSLCAGIKQNTAGGDATEWIDVRYMGVVYAP